MTITEPDPTSTPALGAAGDLGEEKKHLLQQTSTQTDARSHATDSPLGLTADQLQIRDWVHGFAKAAIRPAAHEWDEREQTPWPIIEGAARVGVYSLSFF